MERHFLLEVSFILPVFRKNFHITFKTGIHLQKYRNLQNRYDRKEREVRKMEEPKEFVRDYHMEKDIISIAKGNYDHEKYPESLDAYKAYYKKHYGGMKEETLTYRFFLHLFLKPTVEYVLKQTSDWERFVQVVMESDLVDFCLLQQKGNVSYEERLFAKIESWLCTLQVRKVDENGKLRWIVDLEGHTHVDI